MLPIRNVNETCAWMFYYYFIIVGVVTGLPASLFHSVLTVVQFHEFIGFVCDASARVCAKQRRIRQKQICLLSLNAFCPLTSYTRCYCCHCCCRQRRRWWWWCNCKSSLCVYVAHVRRWVILAGIKQHFCLHFTVAVPEIWHTLVLKKTTTQQQQQPLIPPHYRLLNT